MGIVSETNKVKPHTLRLRRIQGTFAICKLPPRNPIPPWAMSGDMWSVTRTESELSVLCDQASLPREVQAERNWRALQVAGPLPFDMVGVLSSLLTPIADAGVSIFAFSTFDTDFVLVREEAFENACQALRRAGHTIVAGEAQP